MKRSYSSDIFTRLHAKDAKDNVLVVDDKDGLKYRVFSSSSSRSNRSGSKVAQFTVCCRQFRASLPR